MCSCVGDIAARLAIMGSRLRGNDGDIRERYSHRLVPGSTVPQAEFYRFCGTVDAGKQSRFVALNGMSIGPRSFQATLPTGATMSASIGKSSLRAWRIARTLARTPQAATL